MEPYYPFIEYLKRKVIIDMLPSDELKNMLDQKLLGCNSSEERIELLNAVDRLWKSKSIDANDKGVRTDFIAYARYLLTEEVEKAKKETPKDWASLYDDLLDIYITDISLSDFNNVMNYHQLIKRKTKIKWIAKKTEAIIFLDWFNFTIREFNHCFVCKDGKAFSAQNRTKTNPGPRFKAILENHKL